MQSSRPILIASEIWDELDSYDKNLKSKFIRAFRFISRNIQHPSLRTEIIRRGGEHFFRVRVNLQYRIHLDIAGGYYRILAVGPHHLQGIG